MVVQDQAEMGEGSTNPTDSHHTPTFIQPLTSQPQKKQKPRKPKGKDTQMPQSSGPTEHVADKAVYKELDDSLVRAATTVSSLEVEQDSGNINKTQSKAKPNESSSLGTTSGGGPMRQETIGDTIAQNRFENVSKLSNDPLLARGEDKCFDEDITLVNDQDDADMFDVNTLTSDEVLAEQEVAAKDVNLIVNEVTLAQALAALKSVKPKVKANVVKEPIVQVSASSTKVSAATTTTTATIPTPRKGIVITELEEPVKPKKKDLIRLDEEIASKLQAEFDEEERLTREKDEANLAQRLQAQEQEELTDEEKAILFIQFLEQRRKHFAVKRAKEKRNKPPTQAQQIKIIAFKRVTKKKKVDDVQETAKVDDDQETSKIKEIMKIVSDEEEVAIDAIPLVVKPLSIVDWKIHKEGKKTYYQIIRADGSSKMYLVFSYMLKSFDSEDLETLWKLVKAKHGSTRPEEGYERVLWYDLKGMFEPHVEDTIYMLVEKKYHLTPATITDMLNKKLQLINEAFKEETWDFEEEYQVQGRIVGIKRLLDDLRVTVAQCLLTCLSGAYVFGFGSGYSKSGLFLRELRCQTTSHKCTNTASALSVHIISCMIRVGIYYSTTAEEKAQKRLEVKARSTLMMGIPNEHQLKFKPHYGSKAIDGSRIDPLTGNAEGVDYLNQCYNLEQLAINGRAGFTKLTFILLLFFSQHGKFLIHTLLQCLSGKDNYMEMSFSYTMHLQTLLATNQKFNFSKYIFESMVKNLDNLSGKFLMYPRINAIDADEDITLVNDQDDADMFDVNTLTGDEVLAEQEVAAKDVNLTVDEVTLAQALAALKSVKPKVKANVIEEPSVPVSATSTKDKGKGILVEEPVKPKKKDLIRLDEEITSKLQDEFDEEERLAREKDEASVALTEE
ncbi:hypothetical protein Tco_0468687 [Tanacetum coccineum]